MCTKVSSLLTTDWLLLNSLRAILLLPAAPSSLYGPDLTSSLQERLGPLEFCGNKWKGCFTSHEPQHDQHKPQNSSQLSAKICYSSSIFRNEINLRFNKYYICNCRNSLELLYLFWEKLEYWISIIKTNTYWYYLFSVVQWQCLTNACYMSNKKLIKHK